MSSRRFRVCILCCANEKEELIKIVGELNLMSGELVLLSIGVYVSFPKIVALEKWKKEICFLLWMIRSI